MSHQLSGLSNGILHCLSLPLAFNQLCLHLLDYSVSLFQRVFHRIPLSAINHGLIDNRQQGKGRQSAGYDKGNDVSRDGKQKPSDKDQPNKGTNPDAANNHNLLARELLALLALCALYGASALALGYGLNRLYDRHENSDFGDAVVGRGSIFFC